MVTVTSATSTKPNVFPLMSCSTSGQMVTLGCLATDFSPSSVTFSWENNGTAVANSIQYPPVLKGGSYMAISETKVSRQDWEAKNTFKCLVKHAEGNGQATFIPQETIYKSPTVKVCSSDDGTETAFSCFAKDFSPKQFEMKWLRNGVEVTNKKDEVKALSEGRKDANGTMLYSATSFLTVQPDEWSLGVTFTCVFTGKKDKNAPAPVNSSVTFIPPPSSSSEGCPDSDVDINIKEVSLRDIFLKKKGALICEVHVRRGPVEKIYWEDENGDELADSEAIDVNRRTGPFQAKAEITFAEWEKGAKRTCVVEHNGWTQPRREPYERKIGKSQRPAVFMLPPVEHTRENMVTLTCYVKNFFPHEILVSWLVDDEEADSKYKFTTTNAVENSGSYSAYGQLSLPLDQWKQTDVVYSCVVYHESMANSTRAIVRSIAHRTFEKTNLVNLNMNIPETCKAQ